MKHKIYKTGEGSTAISPLNAKGIAQSDVTAQIDEMAIAIIFARLLAFGRILLIIAPHKIDTNDAMPNDGIISIAITYIIIIVVTVIITIPYCIKTSPRHPPHRVQRQAFDVVLAAEILCRYAYGIRGIICLAGAAAASRAGFSTITALLLFYVP
jgi:hypothetical protein